MQITAWANRTVERVDWLAPLLVRLFFGYFWAETGWAKLHNLAGFAQRFAGWGIPYPYATAMLSAYTEWLGGLLLMGGLLTRLVSLPLAFNMIVATVTVKLRRVTGLNDFVELDEPLYVLIFFWFATAGAGRASLDYLVGRVVRKLWQASSQPAPAASSLPR